LDVEFPAVVKGPPAPIFTSLAREHPWDIGEQAFSTYLMAYDLGKPQIALPVFPSRFFPHTGMWVNTQSGIHEPKDLIGKRIGCASFATNYSVWFRGALTHQYDLPVEQMAWIESVEEHLSEYRAPKRFTVEKVAGGTKTAMLLAEGKIDAGIMAGVGPHVNSTRMRPLFSDPYAEIRNFARDNPFFPINTVITVSKDAMKRNPEMPRLMMKAFIEAKRIYDREIAQSDEDDHMGVSLKRLNQVTGLTLTDYGFKANRDCIRTMIAYCFEQGIISKLPEPEEVFLSVDH